MACLYVSCIQLVQEHINVNEQRSDANAAGPGITGEPDGWRGDGGVGVAPVDLEPQRPSGVAGRSCLGRNSMI